MRSTVGWLLWKLPVISHQSHSPLLTGANGPRPLWQQGYWLESSAPLPSLTPFICACVWCEFALRAVVCILSTVSIPRLIVTDAGLIELSLGYACILHQTPVSQTLTPALQYFTKHGRFVLTCCTKLQNKSDFYHLPWPRSLDPTQKAAWIPINEWSYFICTHHTYHVTPQLAVNFPQVIMCQFKTKPEERCGSRKHFSDIRNDFESRRDDMLRKEVENTRNCRFVKMHVLSEKLFSTLQIFLTL